MTFDEEQAIRGALGVPQGSVGHTHTMNPPRPMSWDERRSLVVRRARKLEQFERWRREEATR